MHMKLTCVCAYSQAISCRSSYLSKFRESHFIFDLDDWLLRFDGDISLAVIIVNRLVLNLRQLGGVRSEIVESGPLVSDPIFASGGVLGNIGAPLRYGWDDADVEGQGDGGGTNTKWISPSIGMGNDSEVQSAYALELLSRVEEEVHGQHAVIEEIGAGI